MAIVIYKHTNKINGKVYIGLTSQNPKKRWRNGKGYTGCTLFNKAIQRYGWDNFEHEILIECENKEDASAAEKYYVNLYQSNRREYGYNLEAGGYNKGEISPETREKLRIASSVKHTKERTEKTAAKHRGLKHTNETRQRMSESQKRYASSLAGKERHKKIVELTSKAVVKLADNGEIVCEYPSIEEAARLEAVSPSGISRACSGVQKRSCGYMWQFKTEKKPCGRCAK